LWIRAVTIDVVVEDQLLACFDVSLGENAHPEFVIDYPLVHEAVRIARVVAEPSKVALLRSIYELTLRKRHEVEVLDTFFIILNHASAEISFSDDFTNILENKVASPHVNICAQAKAFLVGLDDCDVGVLFSLEALVFARVAAAAVIQALHFRRTIDAVGIFTTSTIDHCDWIYK
jgi:hypothetical protein